MKILPSSLGEDARHRWKVLSRVVAATLGGHLIASLSVPLISLLFASDMALATHSAVMFSFVVWLLVILWVFSTRTAKKAWLGTVGTAILLATLVWLLKLWRLA